MRRPGTALLPQSSSSHQMAPPSMKCSVQNLGIIYESSLVLHKPTFKPSVSLVHTMAKPSQIASHLPLLSSATT